MLKKDLINCIDNGIITARIEFLLQIYRDLIN